MTELSFFSTEGRRPLEPEFFFSHLTWLEHALIGSTVQDENGLVLPASEVLKKGPKFYLRPVGVTENTSKKELAEMARRRNRRYIDKIEIFEKRLKGYSSRLFLPGLFPNGEIQGIFNFQLIDQDTSLPLSSDELRDLLNRINQDLVEEFRDTLYLDLRIPLEKYEVGHLSVLLNQSPLDPYRDFKLAS